MKAQDRTLDADRDTSPAPVAAVLAANAIYARVSTVEQAEEGISLDAQEAELRALIESRYPDEPIVPYREEGKSARGGKKRPQYDELCAAITAGRVRRVFAVERSRLTRDVSEWLHLRKLCADHSVHLETVNGGVEDTSTAAGKLLGTMLAALAEFESDLKSERVKRATDYLLSNGKSHGPVPFGIRRRPDGVREPNEHFSAVEVAFRLVAEGQGIKHAARVLSAAAGKTVTPTRLRDRILRNPTYAGLTRSENGALVSTHEPFVPADLWHRVQATLDKNAEHQHRAVRRNPLGDLLRCGNCGGRYEWHPSGAHPILRCENRRTKQCDAPSLAPENAEVTVLAVLSDAYTSLSNTLADPTWTWALTWPEEQEHRRARLADTTLELACVEEEANKLHDAYINLGTLSRDEYAERARALRDRRVALEAVAADLGRTEKNHREALESLRDTIGAEKELRERTGDHFDTIEPALRPFAYWISATVEERAAYLRAVLRDVTLVHDGGGPIVSNDGSLYFLAVAFKVGPVLQLSVSRSRDDRAAILRSYGYGGGGDNDTWGNHGFPHAEEHNLVDRYLQL